MSGLRQPGFCCSLVLWFARVLAAFYRSLFMSFSFFKKEIKNSRGEIKTPPTNFLCFSFCSLISVLAQMFSVVAILTLFQWRIHEDTVIFHIKVYATEFIYIFLMDRLWIQILEEIWMEQFCKVCSAYHERIMTVLATWAQQSLG